MMYSVSSITIDSRELLVIDMEDSGVVVDGKHAYWVSGPESCECHDSDPHTRCIHEDAMRQYLSSQTENWWEL